MGKIRDVISAARTAYPSEAPEFIFMFYMFFFFLTMVLSFSIDLWLLIMSWYLLTCIAMQDKKIKKNHKSMFTYHYDTMK
jgi:hypothetical protein